MHSPGLFAGAKKAVGLVLFWFESYSRQRGFPMVHAQCAV